MSEAKTLADKLATIDAITAKINKKYNKTVVGRMGISEDIINQITIGRIPTPSIALNNAIGGGFPRKRCTLITGKSDSGKTTLILESISKIMAVEPSFTALWVESEHSIDKEYIVDTFGVDPNRLIFVPFDPEIGSEATLDMVQTIIESDSVDLVAINSLKALIPQKENEASLTEVQVALAARQNAKMSRKFTALVAKHNIAFIIVSHLTTDIGSLSRDPMVISGGAAIQYWSSLTLDMRKRAIGPGDPITKEEGLKIHVAVKKNHTISNRNPYVQVDYYAIFGKGIDQMLEVIEEAFNSGVLVQRGAWINWLDSNGEVIEKFNGRAAMKEFFHNNPDKWIEFKSLFDGSASVKELSQEEIKEIEEESKAIEETIPEEVKTQEKLKNSLKKTKKKKADKEAK